MGDISCTPLSAANHVCQYPQGSFSLVFDKQNTCVESAIKSLDHLNDQIVQFIFSTRDADYDNSNLTKRDHETLKSSVGVMRGLLVDAQYKFRKMVEDNRNLASRIDGSLQSANEEVSVLRVELLDANKRLNQLSQGACKSSLPVSHSGSQTIIGVPAENGLHTKSTEDRGVSTEDSKVPTEGSLITCDNNQLEQIKFLETENARLEVEITSLLSELEAHRQIAAKEWGGVRKEADGEDGCGQHQEEPLVVTKEAPAAVPSLETELFEMQQELARAHEAMRAMKGDRKRLKSEKLELLGQLKQLYSNLEDKETELRSFIRSYEQRMYQADHTIKQLASEKEASEKEKWQVKQELDEVRYNISLMRSELDQKQTLIDTLQSQLLQFQTQSTCSTSCSALQHHQQSHESVNSADGPGSIESQLNVAEVELPTYQEVSMSAEMTGIPAFHHRGSKSMNSGSMEASPAVAGEHAVSERASTPVGSTTSNNSNSSSINVRAQSGLEPQVAPSTDVGLGPELAVVHRRNRDSSRDSGRDIRRKSPGPLSRMFGKSRSRRSLATSDPNIDTQLLSSRLSILSQENYQDKLTLVTSAMKEHVSSWKASHVLAWLELEMNMPSYGRACSENIKSGKVLLGLSDAELDSALGLEGPLHRRKLRLAIEELREPSNIKYPQAAGMNHTWVADYFLTDIGLPQYASVFREQLVDGRLLNVLTRRDLERHLCVQRKFHQASILHGVDLLRRLLFNKEALRERQAKTEDNERDPIVWTNNRIISWLESIDLHEYAPNLRESGVHGPVLVVEQGFTADTLATALGIPQSKSYVRRHLATELETLIRPARAALEAANKRRPPSSGSLGRSFTRSYRSSSEAAGTNGKRLSLRGSFGKAFGSKKDRQGAVSSDKQSSGTDTAGIQRASSMELTTAVL